MAGKRKVYTSEFKLAAVKMITEQKLSVAEVARRLGVTENRLHDGKKAVAKKGADAFPGSGHLTPSRRSSDGSGPRSRASRWSATSLKKPRRSSPPRRRNLRRDRGAPPRVADHATVSRAGGLALGVLRLAVARAQRDRGPTRGVGHAGHDDPRPGEGAVRQPAHPRRTRGAGRRVRRERRGPGHA